MSGAISATTLGIIGAVGAAGSVASSAIQANSAGNAASTQAQAAQQAAQLQAQAGQKALGIEQDQYGQTQQNFSPYLQAGAGGLNALQYGLGTGGQVNGSGVGKGSLLTPYQSFTAPNGLTEQNDPGYQARLQLGTDALQRSAAARGSVLTGGTAKALDSYAQDYASNEYGNVYNRALQTYGANATNYYNGQNNQYSRLAGLANNGQSAVGSLGQIGASTANSEANTVTGTAANQGQQLNNAAAATASGYIGSGNAYANGIAGVGNGITNLALLHSMSGYGNQGNSVGTYTNELGDQA